MNRRQLLAAEIHGYSYANYQDHLGANERFDRLMPEAVDILEASAEEAWPIEKVADALDVDIEDAKESLAALERARKVVDAENPAESIDELTTQICYCAADLACLLKQNGESLSRYSRHLRRESDVQYYDGCFDEEE